jgi:hypothetical protein
VRIEVTPQRKLIALVEARRNGSSYFLLMGDLPEESIDISVPLEMTWYPLDRMQNELCQLTRFHMSASRSLISILLDIDSIGISTLKSDWHLSELDDFNDDTKLSIQLTSDDGNPCQIIGYTSELASILKPEVIYGPSIVAETVYESGSKYFLKQTIKMESEVYEETVELPKPEKNEQGSDQYTVPLAVALSQGDIDPKNTHNAWVLGLSAIKQDEETQRRMQRKSNICSLKLLGWACQYENQQFTLVEQTIQTEDFQIELSCSLDIATQIGLGASLAVVGSDHYDPNKIDKVRLVAVIGAIQKAFILVLSRSTSESNTWTLEGVEWQLPTSPEQDQKLLSSQDSYKLRVVSTFVPKQIQESEEPQYGNQTRSLALASDISRRDRIGIYWQGQAEDMILTFEHV